MSDRKTEFIKYERSFLWTDLQREERYSLSRDPDTPSMAMENIMERIKVATSLVGPLDWVSIPISWLVSGRYEHWAKHMGIEYSMPTEEELATLKEKTRIWNENL